jgi:hypothetical protein
MIDVVKIVKILSEKVAKRLNQIDKFYKNLSLDVENITTSLKDFSKKDDIKNIDNKINKIKNDTEKKEELIKNELNDLNEHYKSIKELINEKLSEINIENKNKTTTHDVEVIVAKHILNIKNKNAKEKHIVPIDYTIIYKNISEQLDKSLSLYKKENSKEDIDIDEIIKKVLENIDEPVGIKDIKEKNGKIIITLTNGKTKSFSLPKSKTFIANTGIGSLTQSNIFSDDIELTTPDKGIILISENGTKYRLTVNNDGKLETELKI